MTDTQAALRVAPLPKQSALNSGKVLPLEARQQGWYAQIPADIEFEEILKSAYWKHYAHMFKPDNIIRAVREDGAWAADLWVLYAEGPELKLGVYHKTDFDTGNVGAVHSDLYEVRWMGPGAKFCIINRATKQTVKDGLYPKTTAFDWLRLHLGKVRA